MIRLMSIPDMTRHSPDPVLSCSVVGGAGPSPRHNESYSLRLKRSRCAREGFDGRLPRNARKSLRDKGKENLMQAIKPPLWETWRPGVQTRMLVSALNGAAQLCIFEQQVAPGTGAPTHSRPVEEVLTVLEGEADMWIG